jgi:Acetyltransferase (GNAT) domain
MMPTVVAAKKSPPPELTDSSPNTEARCRVVVVERGADLAPFLSAWTALLQHAIEPNVFYEPWFLTSALRAFSDRAQSPMDLAVVLVLGEPAGPPSRTPKNELWGLFPLQRRPSGDDLPISHFRLFQHDYSYLPVPLVHRAYADMVVGAFFDWLLGQKRCPPVLAIDDFPIGGPFHALVIDEIARRKAHVFIRDRWNRALLAPPPSCNAETYEARALAGKHRKELRRQKRRLGELGEVTFDILGKDGDVETWLSEFMVLEASGWKGREGTALGSRIPDAIFFLEMARACHQAGRLEATALRLNGQPIVIQILLRSGDGAFAFKIGYDESYSRFSPGVLLEIDLIERVVNSKLAAWIDSAATRDHPMINRLWTERRTIERWVIGLDNVTGLLLTSMPMIQWAKNLWRRRRGLETKK